MATMLEAQRGAESAYVHAYVLGLYIRRIDVRRVLADNRNADVFLLLCALAEHREEPGMLKETCKP